MIRFYHSAYIYKCSKCGCIANMKVEKGLEEECNSKLKEKSGLPHKPTPFVICCKSCRTGMMRHIGTYDLDHFERVKKGDDLFMNVKKLDCGKPVFGWKGE